MIPTRNNKRPRTAFVSNQVRLCTGLQKLLGGREVVCEGELSRDVLLQFLMNRKEVIVCHPRMENDENVESANSAERAADLLVPCFKPSVNQIATSWDIASPAIANQKFQLSGRQNSIATKVGGSKSLGLNSIATDFSNCLVTQPIGAGKQTVSFKVLDATFTMLGLVHHCGSAALGGVPEIGFDGQDLAQSNSGWFISVFNGRLCGKGFSLFDTGRNQLVSHGHDCKLGPIKIGQVLTIEVDQDLGELKFWVDGKAQSTGYFNCAAIKAAAGDLRWAMNTGCGIGDSIQIVPTP